MLSPGDDIIASVKLPAAFTGIERNFNAGPKMKYIILTSIMQINNDQFQLGKKAVKLIDLNSEVGL